jgi:hypothetical protein
VGMSAFNDPRFEMVRKARIAAGIPQEVKA